MQEKERIAAAAALVDGHDVMAALGIGPGPEVGRQLARVRERQALGLTTTRDDALAYLGRRRSGSGAGSHSDAALPAECVGDDGPRGRSSLDTPEEGPLE